MSACWRHHDGCVHVRPPSIPAGSSRWRGPQRQERPCWSTGLPPQRLLPLLCLWVKEQGGFSPARLMPLEALSHLGATQNGSVNSACLMTEHERQVASCHFCFPVPVRMTLSEIGQGALESTGHQLLPLSEIGQGALASCRDHPSLWREHPGNGKLPILLEGAPWDAILWGDLDARASSFRLGREGGAKWLQRTPPSGIHHKQGAPPGDWALPQMPLAVSSLPFRP